MISIDPYFSIESFARASLWRTKETVWEALFYLREYIQSLPFEIQIPLPEGVFLKNRETIFIGEGTQIDPGVLIEGPCYIGKNCRIHHGAFLREHVFLSDGCTVGHGSEIKHSLLFPLARVTHLCYVGDSIIGPNANLGAGVKCSNLRLDGEEISIRTAKGRIKTGLRKFGSILGENCQIGCNAVLNPGTLVGRGSFIYPLMNIGGVIEPNTKLCSSKSFV